MVLIVAGKALMGCILAPVISTSSTALWLVNSPQGREQRQGVSQGHPSPAARMVLLVYLHINAVCTGGD